MNREEAIELLSERYLTMSMCADKDDCIRNNTALDMAIGALRKLERYEWISVNDKLPEVPQGYKQIQVIVWRENGLYTAWFQADNREFYDMPGWLGSKIDDVSHWMPRPLPPREVTSY